MRRSYDIKDKQLSLPYSYRTCKTNQLQQNLICNVNYYQPHRCNERCLTEIQEKGTHMKLFSFQNYNKNEGKLYSKYGERYSGRNRNGSGGKCVCRMRSYWKEDEMKIIDIKMRCDIIQSKLRKLRCLSLSQHEEGIVGITNNGKEILKGENLGSVIRNHRFGNGNKNKNKKICVNSNVSGEEDNLSDIADDIVETFDLEQKFENNEKHSFIVNSNNINDKEINIKNIEQPIKEIVLVKEQPKQNIIEISAYNKHNSPFQKLNTYINNNNLSNSNNNTNNNKNSHILSSNNPFSNTDIKIDPQESTSILPTPKRFSETATSPTFTQPSSLIIHELSFQTTETPPPQSINPTSQHLEHSQPTELLNKSNNDNDKDNENDNDNYNDNDNDEENDDDKIISQILETAELQSRSTTPQEFTFNELHQVASTESYKPSTPPKEFVSSISKRSHKKVKFNYDKTITIQYNENELITHLKVFDVKNIQMNFKPRVVKNYKHVSNMDLKPCISEEYTKHLKLPKTKKLKVLTVKGDGSSGCNSRNSSLKKGSEIKREKVVKEKGKVRKGKIRIIKMKETKLCKCQIRQRKHEEHLEEVRKRKENDNSFDIASSSHRKRNSNGYLMNESLENSRKNSV